LENIEELNIFMEYLISIAL